MCVGKGTVQGKGPRMTSESRHARGQHCSFMAHMKNASQRLRALATTPNVGDSDGHRGHTMVLVAAISNGQRFFVPFVGA